MLGGAEKQALYLAGELQNRRNCQVFIYSYIPSKTRSLFDAECRKYQLKNLYLEENPLSASGSFKYIKRRIKLFLFGRKLRKHSPDIIIPYLNPPAIIANICYKVAGAKKTFWHHRGVDYYRKDAIEKLASKRAKFFVANSRNGAEELKKELRLQRKTPHSLANFTTIEKVNPANKDDLKQEHNIPKDSLVIGMIAHFRPEKRQKILLEACFSIFKDNSKIHLVLVGNDYSKDEQESEFKSIHSMIKESQNEDRVTILHNTNSQDILPMFDLGVLLSANEGMPNVVMEYMAYALPIITNPHAGCLELLGEDYAYFTKNESIEVAEKLSQLINDQDARMFSGQKNKKRLDERFSIDRYITNLETILNR